MSVWCVELSPFNSQSAADAIKYPASLSDHRHLQNNISVSLGYTATMLYVVAKIETSILIFSQC